MNSVVGVPRETAADEGRIAATPAAVRALVNAGRTVLVEQEAGSASGFSDEEYLRAGAELVPTAEELYGRSDRIWKVCRPEGHELSLLRPEHQLLCLVHDGPPLPCRVNAAEKLQNPRGDAPVRAAMAEIAGRLAVEAASQALQLVQGGRGLLLGGVPGVDPAEVVVIGIGTAGRAAASLASAMGASVTALDLDLSRLRALGLPGVRTVVANAHSVERALARADVVIAAVRDAQGAAPRLAGRGHLALMAPGAVVVDLSILDGGAFATTPRTTLSRPAELVDGIVHIGVPNLPGAVPRTSSVAYAIACLPWMLSPELSP